MGRVFGIWLHLQQTAHYAYAVSTRPLLNGPIQMHARTLRITGFLVAILAAALMVLDVVNIGWGAAIGMVGIGLIAAPHMRDHRE